MKNVMRVILGVLAVSIWACSGAPKEETVVGAISGSVVLGDGYLGSVVLYDLRADGGIIADSKNLRTQTKDGGQFSFDLPGYASGPILLVASGGTYLDLARGDVVTLPEAPGSGISYLIPNYAPGSKISNLAVTPFSTLHAAVSAKLVETKKMNLVSAAATARDRLQHLFVGVDMLSLPYRNISKNSSGDSDEATIRGLLLGGFSNMAKAISDRAPNSSKVGLSNLALALTKDYESNGMFDGLTKTGDKSSALFLPVDAKSTEQTQLTPMTLRYDLAINTQTFIRGTRNLAGIREDDFKQIKEIAGITDELLFGDQLDAGSPIPAPTKGVPMDGEYITDDRIAPRKNADGTLKLPVVFDYPTALPYPLNNHQPLGEGKTVQRFSSLLNELVTPDRRVFLRMKYTYNGPPFSIVNVTLTGVDANLDSDGGWTPYSGNVPELTGGVAKLVADAGFGDNDAGADAGTALVYEYQLPKGTPYGNLKFTWKAKTATGEFSESDYHITLQALDPPLVVTEDENYSKANDPESIWYVNSGRLAGYRPGARIVRYQVQNPLDERLTIYIGEISSISEDYSIPSISLTETWNISNDLGVASNQKRASPVCLEKSYYHPYYQRTTFQERNFGENYRCNGSLCLCDEGKNIWGECFDKVASKTDGVGMSKNVCHNLPDWAPCGEGHGKKPFLPASKYELSCAPKNESGYSTNLLCIGTNVVGDPFGFIGNSPVIFTSNYPPFHSPGNIYNGTPAVLKDGKQSKVDLDPYHVSGSFHDPAWVIPASSEKANFDIYLVSKVDRNEIGIKSPQGVPAPSIVDTSTDLNYLGYTYDTHGCLRYADDSPADARCTSTGAFVYAWPYLRGTGAFVFGAVCRQDEVWTTSKWDGYSVYGQLKNTSYKIDLQTIFYTGVLAPHNAVIGGTLFVKSKVRTETAGQ